MTDPAILIEGLRFAWKGHAPVLDVPSFRLARGERLFLRGPSGSGKSTLLGVIAGVLEADAGKVSVLGQDLAALSSSARDRMRADHLGVIFQMFNLVPYLSVVGNVTLPLKFSAARRKAVGGNADAEARRLLGRLGLTDDAMLDRRVSDLSVGQQQRVAAARALIGAPEIVIADEPTSALDTDARDRFIALLSEEAARTGAALLFVSHDASLARLFDRAVDLAEINRAGAIT
ncbi:MAG: ABC transporter ATP-binding protein [Alphaproteobacteria bacterium]|nr:ABC transporter ATP-binding protein [Alphaproteobacteria bacterium]MBU2084616.1 ABC transporter ATP-binding protein [Alphaproteobacteria bacterium]MBU2141973.1 ABC transporter ATP-binding protein [Alphaproteobacteria bacterium]MBU2198415.1 ABC transporter ATP-binding protein [Alphaproteobacteria bacterium]